MAKKSKGTAGSKFEKLPRLVQILLLLIPGVNWITEIIVRVSCFIHKADLRNFLGLLFGILVPCINGWIDLIWILFFKHLFLSKA